MRRRDFLKGIFGAAAIAAVPTIALKQIEELTPTEGGGAMGNIYSGPINPEENILYVYDENQLVGWSNMFDLNLHQNINPIPKSRWVKLPWDGRYYKNKKNKKGLPKKKHRWQLIEDYNAPLEYIQGLKSWDLQTHQMQWLSDPMELFERMPTQLHCLMVKDTIKFSGDVILTQLDTTSNLDEKISYIAMFNGSGELIATVS